ncbi:recombinase family protein [Poseidonibacter lekithochrous]|uniref:recombinase family protein n=1 Tax=Poseidonibacter lekithochrous TaxID=1904463 RepID=UPI0008FCA541|nr:recombinase family protein [Poseidonibacter lekithochrous]QKJ22308.1 resolvase [Poseidonibacter lekithochrous]
MLIGYVRVSTEDQSLNLQKDALIKYGIDSRNIFEDKVSGLKEKKVGLEKALMYLNEGDTLVVWKLDRLGRSLAHLINTINLLKERNISFISITEGMDTTTASGELFFHIFGALAQFERSLIQERVNSGLDAARKRGNIGGRPRAISDEKLQVIKEALDNGMSKAAACRTFDVKRSTLIDSLSRLDNKSST